MLTASRVGWSVYHFGPHWNISTTAQEFCSRSPKGSVTLTLDFFWLTVGWMALKFVTNIRVLTFSLVKYCNFYQMDRNRHYSDIHGSHVMNLNDWGSLSPCTTMRLTFVVFTFFTTGWIAIRFGVDINVPPRRNCCNFVDLLAFPLVPLSGQNVILYFGVWPNTWKLDIPINRSCALCFMLIIKYWQANKHHGEHGRHYIC